MRQIAIIVRAIDDRGRAIEEVKVLDARMLGRMVNPESYVGSLAYQAVVNVMEAGDRR